MTQISLKVNANCFIIYLVFYHSECVISMKARDKEIKLKKKLFHPTK